MNIQELLELIEKKFPSEHMGQTRVAFFTDGSGAVTSGTRLMFVFRTIDELTENLGQ